MPARSGLHSTPSISIYPDNVYPRKAYHFTSKMEAVNSSETLVKKLTTKRHIEKDSNIQELLDGCCDFLKNSIFLDITRCAGSQPTFGKNVSPRD
jgi:hypothetical protein